MSSVPTPLLKVDNTVGALLLGVIISGILYGVTVAQLGYYFTVYTRDSPFLKWTVAVLAVSDTTQAALAIHSIYWYVVVNYFSPLALDHIIWSLSTQIILVATTTTAVRCFFFWRIWILNGRRWPVPVLFCILQVVDIGFVIAASIDFFGARLFSVVIQRLWLPGVALGISALSDILVSLTMVYYLRKQATGFAKTDTIINTLSIWTLHTGALTGICATLTLVFMATLPHTMIFISCYLAFGKVYVNSMLATLNSRQTLRDRTRENMSISMQTNASRYVNLGSKRQSLSMAVCCSPIDRSSLIVEFRTGATYSTYPRRAGA
ncbi:hypothetical protein SISNIDRAFT_260500 [Sistotremastrum niveocremeum HHB9708]|uniref:DUF6534 domain-containing protein n=1 Tax=Sistotremastrum niveocremeum HHB9708 TaxID=1314777 RepID=A0A164P9T3_9AGAM|nr:hypothetical protein SISNIDRAFT_260500 [Sistotremastrum niveocremeum HHB9708]